MSGVWLGEANLRICDWPIVGAATSAVPTRGTRDSKVALTSDLIIWPDGFDIGSAGLVIAEGPSVEPGVLAAAITRPVPLLMAA